MDLVKRSSSESSLSCALTVLEAVAIGRGCGQTSLIESSLVHRGLFSISNALKLPLGRWSERSLSRLVPN